MLYQVEIEPAARRQLKKLARPVQAKVLSKLEELQLEPRPSNVKKLVGEKNAYRVRIEEYRIIYEVYDRVLLVIVIQIGHRREIYRKL